MYASFFGLKQEPFSIAPDPRYLFMSERHREALAHLLYGVGGGGGFVLLSGEIGAGKTTVCRCFLEQVPRRCNVAYIFNPKLTVIELLQSVCQEFSVPLPTSGGPPTTVKDHVDPLNEFLLRTHGVGQNNVLIIDEAQMLSAEVLEQLRLLTNLETNERKLLQIILIGQPELRDLLARPELEQLEQRVIARYHLGALSRSETEQYIRHRLEVAGMTSAMPFDAKALQRIHQLARGVPRRINLLCDRSLLGAYATGRGQVDRAIVDRAASEVFGTSAIAHAGPDTRATRPRWSLAALLGALTASVLLVLSVALRWGGDGTAASSPRPQAAAASAAGSGIPAAMDGTRAGPVAPSAGGSAAAPVFLTAAGLVGNFSGLHPDENAAWRQLGLAWRLNLDESDPCAQAQRSQVQCFRTASSTLALIRQLDRPGFVTLHDAGNRPVYALLTGLSDQSATLRVGDAVQTVSLVSLATLWRGDFATLWRAPPAYAGRPADGPQGPLAQWVSRQLDTLRGQAGPTEPLDEAGWKAQVSAFQRSQGLFPDGLAGPTTLMQLNRATGVGEPRLRSAVQFP